MEGRVSAPEPMADDVAPGPHDTRDRTPPRRPLSLRRTLHLDSNRPDGLHGRLVLEGRARDLFTASDGASTLAEAAVRIETDPTLTVTAATAVPPRPELSALVGTSVVTGFRQAVGPLLAGNAAGALHAALFQDLPVVAMISNYAVLHAGAAPPPAPGAGAAKADVCAGWRAGGGAIAWLTKGATPVPHGPAAPPLGTAGDALAWHESPAPARHTVRRRRRTDVRRDGDQIVVDAMFRDIHVDADGRQTVLHEYDLTVTLDGSTLVVLTADATPRVLPWTECLGAVPTASWIVGHDVRHLRDDLRRDLKGPAACTHLTDALLGLTDVAGLVDTLTAAER
jgi:hypothetical protein